MMWNEHIEKMQLLIVRINIRLVVFWMIDLRVYAFTWLIARWEEREREKSVPTQAAGLAS